jgi:ribosomal protein S18 acetylase RimI-like enzyme
MARASKRRGAPTPAIRPVAAAAVLPLRQAVLRPGNALAECVFAGDDAADTGHFGVFLGPRLVGIASLCREPPPGAATAPGAWRLRGMAVADDCRRRGFGGRLLVACLAHAREHHATLVWCHARTAAVSLYRRHGFQPVGDEYVIPDVGPHYLMTLTL